MQRDLTEYTLGLFFLKETEQSDAAKDLSLVEGSLVSMTSKEL